ncbi:MAG: acetate kinase [gamma proteobacterium symbiont of Bathyaustriella thionipta]|nr:acetate kinase [gamma proteobacterium symbiont of Bathyaustriella thionipta]
MSHATQLILVINSGSSSIKYQLFDMQQQHALAIGLVERLGEAQSRLKQRYLQNGQWQETLQTQTIADHAAGLGLIGESLRHCHALSSRQGLYAIGHRVVHGGERFRQPALIDSDVIEGIRDMIPLAPLHNPANLTGIEVTRRQMPDVPQIAVFDTAFHHTLPAHASHYALPRKLCQQQHIRRYGFHGTSHAYVCRQAAQILQKPIQSLNLISLHLGNGCSAAAVQGGQCIDTSMGMTPLEGLVMGSRCGDIDPAIIFYLARHTGMSLNEIETLLNQQSGLLGLAGISDMREILTRVDEQDKAATLALEVFCYRIKKTIGAYIAALGGLDAVIFTGGIGEHAAQVRHKICSGLEVFGLQMDAEKNTAHAQQLQADSAAVALLLIPTNEELEIARQTLSTLD